MPFLSPCLRRPTKLVTTVQQQSHDQNYIQLNQYRLVIFVILTHTPSHDQPNCRLMEEIGAGSYGIVKLAYSEQDKNLYGMR